MFCKQCGKPIDDGQELCEDCQAKAGIGNNQDVNSNNFQGNNEQPNNMNQNYNNQNYNNVVRRPKSRIAAGILGILVGGLGIHRFYLGYIGIGIIQIVVTILTCGAGSLWGFIEGILILCGTTITTDADGIPLSDN